MKAKVCGMDIICLKNERTHKVDFVRMQGKTAKDL